MRARTIAAVAAATVLGSIALPAQERAYKNSIGMEFVLIQPGTFTLGRFQPPYAKPPDPNAPPPVVPGAGQTIGTPMFGQADANGDQRLSRDELVRLANTWFDQMDPSKSGRLSQADFTTQFGSVQAQLAGTGAARGAGAPPGPGGPPAGGGLGGGRGRGGGGAVAPVLFTASDADRDGAVTREEFTTRFGAWFDAWDAGRTGALSNTQVIAGLNGALPLPTGGRGAAAPLTAEQYRLIEQAARKDSTEGFPVTISRPYYIGRIEVTQAQYRQVMGINPSFWQGAKVTGPTDQHPADSISWNDAQAFVKKLNDLEKTNVYRLPTEFEWEYAARAGASDDIPWDQIRQQAWNERSSTQPVGKMQPNAWGLYDTLGNVWEWVQDFYNEKLFADPTPPRAGKEHVLKGGGFLADVKNLTYMWHGAGPGNKFDVGFRIVRDVR